MSLSAEQLVMNIEILPTSFHAFLNFLSGEIHFQSDSVFFLAIYPKKCLEKIAFNYHHSRKSARSTRKVDKFAYFLAYRPAERKCL